MKYSTNKYQLLEKLSNHDDIIAALAIDQRGALQKMIPGFTDERRDRIIKDFKKQVSNELTRYASAILLDPIYGLDAISVRDTSCGLIMAYEVTGFRDIYRRPELLEDWSVLRLKEKGTEAIKILLYYDVDDTEINNTLKKVFIERVGNECKGADIPFFLEIITYDQKIADTKSKDFAKIKPRKVNEAVKEFSKECYNVDVLKLEVPVNMDFVEGFSNDFVYTKEEAQKYFKEQSDLSKPPFIFLSAGVSTKLFIDTLYFAKESGSTFNGVLCGRATWKGGVNEFLESEEKGCQWLKTTGKENIQAINDALKSTASSWKNKIGK